MSLIQTDSAILTLINTFEVEPEHCDELCALPIEATENLMCRLDGFISANIHQSLDRRHVANYAQWQNQQALDAMMNNEHAQIHMKKAAALATSFSPILYGVVHATSREK